MRLSLAVLWAFSLAVFTPQAVSLGIPSGLSQGDPVLSVLEGARMRNLGHVFQGEPLSHDFVLRVPEGHTLRIRSAKPT